MVLSFVSVSLGAKSVADAANCSIDVFTLELSYFLMSKSVLS